MDPDVIAYLARRHPDRDLVNYVVDGFRHGFDLGLTREPLARAPCVNLSKVLEMPEVAQLLVDEQVQKGHIAGPFQSPPLDNMVFSPINLVEKGETGKYRLIHDLSHPYDGETAVNDCIPPENSKVRYSSIDDVIQMALEIGPTATGSRVDIRSAFMNLPMAPGMLRYLGFTLNGSYYVITSLPFGSASSCLIFERVATLLEWIVREETGRRHLAHYLDDFPLLGTSEEDVQNFIDDFTEIMGRIGMPVAEEKTLLPTQLLVYLGLLLDLLRQVLTIPDDKREHCIQLIEDIISAHRARSTVIVKTVQQLAGHLNFICQAIPAGRTFLSGLYAMMSGPPGKIVRPSHHRRVNRATHDDMVMFHSFLTSLGRDNRSVPFLIRLNRVNATVELFADAAGAMNLAAGCVYKSHWAQGFWSDTRIFSDTYVPNIALLELLAITMAFELWIPHVQGSVITLRSDNQATCCWLTSRRSKIPAAMDLLRHLTLRCLSFQVYIQAEYIPSADNRQADLVSRNRLRELFREYPEMDRVPTALPASLWPPRWSRDEMEPRSE